MPGLCYSGQEGIQGGKQGGLNVVNSVFLMVLKGFNLDFDGILWLLYAIIVICSVIWLFYNETKYNKLNKSGGGKNG